MRRDFMQGPSWGDAAIFRQKISDLSGLPGIDIGTCEAFSVSIVKIDEDFVPYVPTLAFSVEEPTGHPSCRLVGRRILKPGGPTLVATGNLPGECGLSGTWRRLSLNHDRVQKIFLAGTLYDAMIIETFNAHDPEACVFWAGHEPQFDDLVFLSKVPQDADFTLVYRDHEMALPWATSWAKLAQRAAGSVHVKTYESKTLLGEILTHGGKI